MMEEIKDVCYLDNHGDLCLIKDDITLCVGSHHKIRINKLYGPTCVDDLVITFEGDDWNVRKIMKRLRNENRELKQKLGLSENSNDN